ncbi:MAG: GNAT family N-acetyltransferase [Myxococcota bacterium]
MPPRPATTDDYPDFARLFPELATGDPVPAPQIWENEIAPNTVVLEAGDSIAGYVYVQILDGLGYIRHVIVDPAHRGRGFGRVLMQQAAQRIREAGIERWCLNVKPDNIPAVQLYTRVGMTRKHASVSMRMGWAIIERLPPPDEALVTTPLPTDDDAEIERALALPPGLLTQQHGRDDVHLLLCRQGTAPMGMAAFAPQFPGAYPFRANSAAVARALLTAMQPLANPAHDYVQLVFENQPQVATAFDAAGATRFLEFVHFAGDVPAQ